MMQIDFEGENSVVLRREKDVLTKSSLSDN